MEAEYGIVDYGMGNLQSIYNAFKAIGKKQVKMVTEPDAFNTVDAIILPGVGAFSDGMDNLKSLGYDKALNHHVLEEKKPFLGICLGMQFLADLSYENGVHQGLGWISGTVEKIQTTGKEFKVPHMGWNDVDILKKEPLFKEVGNNPVFYFVHSYSFNPVNEDVITSVCFHGSQIVGSVEKDHIFGVQFHPEKSLGAGLKVLDHFCDFVEERVHA